MRLVWLGGYTQDLPMASGEIVPGRSRGIACCALDEETGRLELLHVTEDTVNPSYLAVRGNVLCCANELEAVGGVPGSTVSAYVIEGTQLRPLGRRMAAGPLACHAVFSSDGKHVLAASYNGGVCVLPLGETLEDISCSLRFQGSGPDPDRQEGPHPHQILIHPNGEQVYVCDLGADRIRRFRADWKRGWLTPDGELCARPGQGPRHGVFSTSGRRLCLLTELSGEMDVFDVETGTLIQVLSAMPEGLQEPAMGAAVRMHPGGRFLYASLRGPSLIAIFPVREDGGLEQPAFYPSGGKTPRDFCITPDGRYLLSGGQDDCTVCVHAVNPETGALRQVWRMEGAGSVTAIAAL